MGDAAGYPSEGWALWTFLSSLGENGFFCIQLDGSAPAFPSPSFNPLSLFRDVAARDHRCRQGLMEPTGGNRSGGRKTAR